jgi:electron transfer flavoprotein beta subunit
MLSRTAPSLSAFRSTAINYITVLCGVKRCIAYDAKIVVKDNAVSQNGVKMAVNPFDDIAVEEAVRLKEKKIATEVIAVTIGPKKAEEQLRSALAIGATKAVHVITPDNVNVEPLAVAKILAKLSEEFKPSLVLLGKQAIDGDFASTAGLLAGITDMPLATFANKVEVGAEKKSAKVSRDTDGGQEVVEVQFPAIVTADLRLNTPRFLALPGIMAARKKPIDARPVDKFGGADLLANRLESQKVEEPAKRKAGVVVKSVDELVDKLKNEAKAI